MNSKKIYSLLFTMVLCVSTFNALNKTYGNTTNEGSIKVINEELSPLPEAEVLLGYAIGEPFEANVLVTNEFGETKPFTPWVQRWPISIRANGYPLTTYMDLKPDNHVLSVHPLENDLLLVSGKIDGPRIKNGDNIINFNLTFSPLSRRDILNFQIRKLLSSKSDTLHLPFGNKMMVPSNFSFPRQKEVYGFIAVKLNKPLYTLALPTGKNKIVALNGQFPFKEVIDDFRKKRSGIKIFNKFKFTGGGELTLNVRESIPKQTIKSNKWRLDHKVEVLSNLDLSSKIMLNLSLMTDGQKFFPMDMKIKSQPNTAIYRRGKPKPKPKASFLRFRNVDTPQYILSLLVDKDFFQKGINDVKNLKEVSGVLTPLSTNDSSIEISPKFLDSIPPPKLDGNILTLSPPKITEDITPIGTYITLSTIVNTKSQIPMASSLIDDLKVAMDTGLEIDMKTDLEIDMKTGLEMIMKTGLEMIDMETGLEMIDMETDPEIKPNYVLLKRSDTNLNNKVLLREIFSKDWVLEIQLVDFQENLPPGNYLWEVVYVGSRHNNLTEGETLSLKDFTHFTRNTLETEIK